MKRILLTGGGTGGHVYPLIAVAERLKGVTLRYFGPDDAWTGAMREAGIPTSRIAHAKLRRYFSLRNFVDMPKFLWSILQAALKVGLYRPHAAFSKGGPGSLPVLFACRIWGVPIVIHESDSVPGTANRIAGRWARTVELAWEEAAAYFPGMKTHTVGVPLRAATMRAIGIPQSEAKRAIGLDPTLPLILVVGGSQGAERINALVMEALPELLVEYQVLHQTGGHGYASHMAEWEEAKAEIPAHLWNRYRIQPFFEKDMAPAYAAAACAVSRAGSAIFEIAGYGIPAILIPLPEAAGDHQRKNAEAYAASGASLVMEGDGDAETLMEKIAACLDGETGEAMASAARGFAKPRAAQEIAEDIMGIIR